MLKKIFLSLILIAIFLTLPISKAQNSQATLPGEGLTISPPLMDLTLQPGERSEQIIKITNPTGKIVEVYPTVMNFQASGENGEPTFTPPKVEESSYNLANWIVYPTNKLALTPEQDIEYKFQIAVPADAEAGGHYGVVFFATVPPKPDQKVTQVQLASMIGTLILVKVPGDIKEEAVLKEFSARKFYFKPPVDFIIRLQNLGNIHFKPQGDILIRNWRGIEVGDVAINQKKGNILPQSTRRFDEQWTLQKNSWWRIPIGRMKADLSVSYGTNKSLDGQLSFWIIPWWFIITLSLIIIAVVALIVRKIRKNRRNRPRAQVNERPKFLIR